MMDIFNSIRMNSYGLRESFDFSDRLVSLEDEADPMEKREIVCVDSKTDLLSLLEYASRLRDDLQFIHWNITGDKFLEIHKLTDELVAFIYSDIDFLAEAIRQSGIKVPNRGNLLHDSSYIPFDPEGFSKEEALSELIKKITTYCELLENIMECPEHIKSSIDDMISVWRLKVDYFLRSMDVCEDITSSECKTGYEYGDYQIYTEDNGLTHVIGPDGEIKDFTCGIDAEFYVDSL